MIYEHCSTEPQTRHHASLTGDFLGLGKSGVRDDSAWRVIDVGSGGEERLGASRLGVSEKADENDVVGVDESLVSKMRTK